MFALITVLDRRMRAQCFHRRVSTVSPGKTRVDHLSFGRHVRYIPTGFADGHKGTTYFAVVVAELDGVATS